MGLVYVNNSLRENVFYSHYHRDHNATFLPPKIWKRRLPKNLHITIVSISPGGYYVVPRESKAMVMQFFGGGVQLMVNT